MIQQLDTFRKGLFWLNPFSSAGNLARRFPLIALLVLIFAAYVILKVFSSVSSTWLDIGLAVVSVLLLTMELIVYYRGKRENS